MAREQLENAIQSLFEEKNAPVFDSNNPSVALHHQGFGPEEILAVTEQLISGRVTMGEKVKQFESSYAQSIGVDFGVSNNSGSSANLLMLSALTTPIYEQALNPGDEVIVPALTWSTSLWPILQRGLIPVFVDSDPLTMNTTASAIEAAIGPKTKAVMVVHVYGNPCDMDPIMDVCERYNLILVEDACESMGAFYKGKAVGSFGLISTFSFYFSHHITTLEGGICNTNDLQLAEIMRILRSHGWVRNVEHPEKWLPDESNYDPRFTFVGEGFNLRLTEPQAAMGLVQLSKLKEFVSARQQSASFLKSVFDPFKEVINYQKETDDSEHSWFGMPLLVSENASFSRDEFQQYLREMSIETRPVIAGNLVEHSGVKLYPSRISGALSGADAVMRHGFAIPCHQSLTEDSLGYMGDAITRFLRAKS